MADSQSREVYFLKQVANQKYPEDFAQNLVTVNQTLAAVSKYLISMQQGIDDLNRDIIEVVQDFINEIIVLFGGGAGGDSGFEFGDLKYIFQALGQLFGFGSIGPDWNALEIAQNFFDNFIQGLINVGNSIEDWFQGVMSGMPWFTGGDFGDVLSGIRQNAIDALIGWINPGRIPFLPIGHIGQANPNLLMNGDFNTEVSMDGEGTWTWDGAVGHSSPGSARTTGTGVRKVLTSNPVAVSVGQVLTISGRVRWASAVGTGPTMQLQLVPYIGSTAQAAVTIANVVSPSANSGTFTALSGSHTVAANVTEVRVKITAEAALTAGTVWWDDLSLTKPAQTLPQSWIQNLVGDLFDIDEIASGAASALEQIGEILIGAVVTPVTSAVQRFKDWFVELLGFRSTTTAKVENVSAVAITTGVIDGNLYQLQKFTGSGTFTPPTAPAGYEIDHFLVTVYGGGQGGGRDKNGGKGGQHGGRRSEKFTVAQVGASKAVSIGGGGAGATSQGFGDAGGITRFGSSGAYLLESVPGTSSIPSVWGDLPSSAAPGAGGDGGGVAVTSVASSTSSTTAGTGSHSHSVDSDLAALMGTYGQSSSRSPGGRAGSAGGWVNQTPGAGTAGSTVGPNTSGGSGGGGGGASVAFSSYGQNGANGAAPGGGGGGGGGTNGGLGSGSGEGGNGGPGQLDVLTMFKPIGA